MLSDYAPFELIIFDCDSTLSTVEGIDELARWAGKEAEVADLTNRAMNGELLLEAVYSRRLELLTPTREQTRRLGQLYRETMIADAAEVIAALRELGRQVFIVSGGLAEGVREFGLWLGLPEENIFAVEVEYNQLAGNWWETWKHPAGQNLAEAVLAHDGGPLTIGKGKAEIIRSIRRQNRGRAMLIGDGTSDLEASETVDMFVGFGGVVSREKVRAKADVFITTPALAPILPLALARPFPSHARFQRGVSLIEEGAVTFRNSAIQKSLMGKLGHGVGELP